jgi:hypothetical protein
MGCALAGRLWLLLVGHHFSTLGYILLCAVKVLRNGMAGTLSVDVFTLEASVIMAWMEVVRVEVDGRD